MTDSNYKELVQLSNKYSSDECVVLGFPCNQFGGQEPGSDAEIKQFAQGKYGAKFPLFSKVEVNGNGAHPLFVKLKKEGGKTLVSALAGNDIKWNFGKFLISNGAAVTRYEPPTKPMSIVKDIDGAINRARLLTKK